MLLTLKSWCPQTCKVIMPSLIKNVCGDIVIGFNMLGSLWLVFTLERVEDSMAWCRVEFLNHSVIVHFMGVIDNACRCPLSYVWCGMDFCCCFTLTIQMEQQPNPHPSQKWICISPCTGWLISNVCTEKPQCIETHHLTKKFLWSPPWNCT